MILKKYSVYLYVMYLFYVSCVRSIVIIVYSVSQSTKHGDVTFLLFVSVSKVRTESPGVHIYKSFDKHFRLSDYGMV